MRNSRYQKLLKGLQPLESGAYAPRHWSLDAADPNDVSVLARRASVLAAAWRPEVADRGEFVVDRCRGKRVSDIGCAGHDVSRMTLPTWLHGRIADVASYCVGTDLVEQGIDEMRKLGYNAFCWNLGLGLGPVAPLAPFDVVIAGELIEHNEAIGMIFSTPREVLAPGGKLILTSPNPYAPRHVRAGQLGLIWESADHIVYAFPSGIAELADRNGLLLVEAMTTSRSPKRPRFRGRGAPGANRTSTSASVERHPFRFPPPTVRLQHAWWSGD